MPNKNKDFNGGAITCPHCEIPSTLRKNDTGLFYLESLSKQFKIGDRVSFNSRYGIMKGTVKALAVGGFNPKIRFIKFDNGEGFWVTVTHLKGIKK